MRRAGVERHATRTAPAALCALLCMTASARAQEVLDFNLRVQAPSEGACTPAAALEKAIELRVGGLVFTDDPRADRRIVVHVAHSDLGLAWSARIEMRDADDIVVGERSVLGDSSGCTALDEALVLVLTTMIGIADETKRAPEPEPEPAPPPAQPEPAAPSEPPASVPPAITHDDPATRSRAALELFVSVGGRADLGLLPGLAPGAALAGALDFGDFTLALGATWLPYASEDLGLGASAQFMSALGDASVCIEAAHPFGGSFDFCATVQAGVITSSTRGLYVTTQQIEPVVRGLAGPRLRVPFASGAGVLASLDAAAPIVFSRYFFVEAGGGRRYFHAVDLGISAQLGLYWKL